MVTIPENITQVINREEVVPDNRITSSPYRYTLETIKVYTEGYPNQANYWMRIIQYGKEGKIGEVTLPLKYHYSPDNERMARDIVDAIQRGLEK